jgi:hypothetical protein
VRLDQGKPKTSVAAAAAKKTAARKRGQEGHVAACGQEGRVRPSGRLEPGGKLMSVPVKPALKRAYARDRWYWVPAIAVTTAPTVAEVTASAGFNLSCSLFGDTQDGFDATTDKVTLPRRNCETDVFQVNGNTTHTAPDLMVSFQPQAAAGADGKKAWEALTTSPTASSSAARTSTRWSTRSPARSST